MTATASGAVRRAAARPVAILTFELGDIRLGMLAASVREVYPSATIVPLPQAPSSIEGVLDVRGTMAPVFDVRSRLGLPPRAQGPDDHLIIAYAGERLVVVRVDRALDLVQVPAGDIENGGQLDAGLRNIVGVARLPDGLVVIHDLTTFLSPVESAQLAATLEAR
jgi:purine-binding chemotaxis protein CheW